MQNNLLRMGTNLLCSSNFDSTTTATASPSTISPIQILYFSSKINIISKEFFFNDSNLEVSLYYSNCEMDF